MKRKGNSFLNRLWEIKLSLKGNLNGALSTKKPPCGGLQGG
jgi:hypothetical protein